MSFEANKIAGAILAAMILAMVSGIVANILVHPTPLAKQAYEVAGGAPESGAPAEAAAPAGPEPIAPLMANANADAGKAKIQPLTKDDVAAWRKAMEPVWKKFEGDIGRDLIDAALKSNKQ